MKTSIVTASLVFVFASSLAAVAQYAGFILLPSLTATSLMSGLVAVGVVAFAFSDYSRKPSFGNRRTSALAIEPASATQFVPDNAETDWTYIARSA